MEVRSQIFFFIFCCVKYIYTEELGYGAKASTTLPSEESSKPIEQKTGKLSGTMTAHKNGVKMEFKINSTVTWDKDKMRQKCIDKKPYAEAEEHKEIVRWRSLESEKKGEKGVKGIEVMAASKGGKGEKGDRWIEGLPGIKGEKGEKGEKGDKGIDAIAGAKGEKGEKGDRGTDGLAGVKGEKGEKGDKGDNGIDGIAGAKGEKGEKGDRGTDGLAGVKGEKGETGDKGDNGIDGIAGAKGEKGEKGDTGADGLKGEKGESGERGTNGLSGIKGEKGEKGEEGHKGIDGVAGTKGEKGEKGDKGDQGVKGEKGECGTCEDGFGERLPESIGLENHPAYSCRDIGDYGKYYVNQAKQFEVLCQKYKTCIYNLPESSTSFVVTKDEKVWLSTLDLNLNKFYKLKMSQLSYLMSTSEAFSLTLRYNKEVKILKILSWNGITMDVGSLWNGCKVINTKEESNNVLQLDCKPPQFLPIDFYMEATTDNISIKISSVCFT